jgi:hypothetical protein
MTNEEFIRMVEKLSGRYSPLQVFQDACRMMALAIHSALLCFDPAAKERAEREYAELVEKHGKENEAAFAQLFSAVAQKLEVTRTDFLGEVMTRMGATNKSTSQFLTPVDVSRMMARMTFERAEKPVPGEIVNLSDPCCGAGVLLIEGANAFIDAGGRQGDILIRAEDLDYNAFNIAFVQLSLLGFAAVVTRMDSLSREVFEGPWYTPGYFLHAMPMRLAGKNTTTTTNKE